MSVYSRVPLRMGKQCFYFKESLSRSYYCELLTISNENKFSFYIKTARHLGHFFGGFVV